MPASIVLAMAMRLDNVRDLGVEIAREPGFDITALVVQPISSEAKDPIGLRLAIDHCADRRSWRILPDRCFQGLRRIAEQVRFRQQNPVSNSNLLNRLDMVIQRRDAVYRVYRRQYAR